MTGVQHIKCDAVTIRPDGAGLSIEIANPTPASLWTKRDVANYLNVTPRTIENYMKLRRNPLPSETDTAVMGLPRFDPEAVRAWAKGRK
jgi:hypothetical protein